MAFTSRSGIAALTIVLALLSLSSQGEAQAVVYDHDGHSHSGTLSTTRDRLDFDEPIDLLELRGLWYGEGDQYPYSVYSIFEDTTSLPDCSNHTNEFNYEHYAPDDEHFLLISGFPGAIDRTSASHMYTTPTRILNYTNNILGIYNNNTGVTSCSYWKPYIDLRSGFLKAQVINMNLYSVNSTGQRVTQSLNCQVVGNELPGCYTTQVARAAGIAPTMVQSASIAGGALPPSPQNNVPAGSVLSVNVQTWVCRNGECLTLSPKFSTEDHNH